MPSRKATPAGFVIAMFGALALAGPSVAQRGAPTLTTVVDPNEVTCNIFVGINNRGSILGSRLLASQPSFLLQRGAYNGFAVHGQCYGFNDNGQIVGDDLSSASSSSAFLLHHGVYTLLNAPAASAYTAARGINNSGQIVGFYLDAFYRLHGFLLDHGTYTIIDAPEAGAGTVLSGINNSGQMVGSYFDGYLGSHGFMLEHGVFTPIEDPAEPSFLDQSGTYPTGINDHGQIVGYYGSYYSGTHGFLFYHGVYTTLDDPLGPASTPYGVDTRATGINNQGQIVGFYSALSASGDLMSYISHGFVYQRGAYTDAPADAEAQGSGQTLGINNKDQVVGSFIDSNGVSHGYSRDHGEYNTIDEPDAVYGTYASGINDHGQIVGSYYDVAYSLHGFLLDHRLYTILDDPDAEPGTTVAAGINNLGQIVGSFDDANFNIHGFLLDHGVYMTLDAPGAAGYQTYANGINDRGHVVGFFSDGYTVHGFQLEHGAFATLDAPNAVNGTLVFGINNKGVIVGTGANAFALEGGVYTGLALPGTPYGINDIGEIVGFEQQYLTYGFGPVSDGVVVSATRGFLGMR